MHLPCRGTARAGDEIAEFGPTPVFTMPGTEYHSEIGHMLSVGARTNMWVKNVPPNERVIYLIAAIGTATPL